MRLLPMRLLPCTALLLALSVPPSTALALYGAAAVPAGRGDAAVFFDWTMGGASGSCSGVLISSKAVLTAAHCVRSEKAKVRTVKSVRIGNPGGHTTRAAVAQIHVHPDYDPRKPEAGSDLAVLVLKQAVSGHAPIPVARAADNPTRQGERLTIQGFGATKDGRRLVVSRALREASQEYLSPFHCFSGPVAKMARTRMCAASTESGVCPGDSGAPAVRRSGEKEVVVGIVSLAIDRKRCAETATTLIRVSAFADWIAKTTQSGEATTE